jgi:hypothetical protein
VKLRLRHASIVGNGENGFGTGATSPNLRGYRTVQNGSIVGTKPTGTPLIKVFSQRAQFSIPGCSEEYVPLEEALFAYLERQHR